MRALALLLVAAGPVANADPASAPADDGYCDFVEGVADATADSQLYPELISQFGYINQPPYSINPDVSGLRAIAGVRWRFNAVYEGLAYRDHGHADCRRHQALEQVRGETNARALAAKAKVLDDALDEAQQILKATTADVEARRTTAQEATATRLRVEELRALAADAHRQLSALPQSSGRPLNTALAEYQNADADMESDEARIRRAQAFELSVRTGVDQFLSGTTVQQGTNYFAVVELDVNLGNLFMGSHNSRAADGRRRLLASGHDPLGVDATVDRLKQLVDVETVRAEQTQALVNELQRQMDALARVGGEDSKRYRETVWFDFVKAKAEHAYAAAHLQALHEVLGGAEGP
ncbi:MAG: hypothetical protein ACM31C_16000 [Acidobacteriota bacterium]